MARDVNRLAEMEVFVEVAERGGLSAAARALGLTPSAVSKLMSRLEERLAVRLMNRSTRRLQLTEEGARFHERALRILAELEEAEREASEESSPRGRVRVNANVPFGLHCLLPLVPRFLAKYPEVTLDLALSDRVVDLYEERADVAIRVGPLTTSGLFARNLGESRLLLVASPAYLARAGTPKTPADLARHDCIDFSFARHLEGWPFRVEGRVQRLHVHGKARAGDGETNRRLALSGLPSPGLEFRGSRSSTSVRMCGPESWFRSSKNSTPERGKRYTRCTWTRAVTCRLECGYCWIFLLKMYGSEAETRERVASST
jgi:DNA-binding transcriptional LysR family regulator